MFECVCAGGDGELSVREVKNVTCYSLVSFVYPAPTLFRSYRMKIVGQFLEGHRRFRIAYILDM